MGKEYLKYKRYAHFDKKMSVKKARRLLKNEDVISHHGFFPFIHYCMKSKKLETVNGKVYAKKQPKIRDIYYCAHLDRYIYQHYAHLLGLKYNEYVAAKGIDKCSGAYRIEHGKCNIDFSYEMFEFIKEKNQTIIIIGDFTKFFDNLNHKNLKKRLEKVLESKLGDNLYKVFKSLTKFKYVNMEDLYTYYTLRNKKRSEKYYLRKLNVLMEPREFRKFIVDKNPNTGEKYLKSNDHNFGIVQGSPMSGLLANIYMIDFDKKMNELAVKHGGKYLRYSDDFMLVIDNMKIEEIKYLYSLIQQGVDEAGQIALEKTKTNIYRYEKEKVECINHLVFNTEDVPDIINFLGFSFNGKKVSIRNKTLTKYFYKMGRGIKRHIKHGNDVSLKSIYDRFSIQGSNKRNKNGNKGNFMTYVRRAEKKFKGEDCISELRKKSKKTVTKKIGGIKSKFQ